MKKSYLLLYIVPPTLAFMFFMWAFISQERALTEWWYFVGWVISFFVVSLAALGQKLYVSYVAWLLCSSAWMNEIVFGDQSWMDITYFLTMFVYLFVIFIIGLIEAVTLAIIKMNKK